MPLHLHFDLVTPTALVRSEDVYMVTVPGTEGDLGVLHGAGPLITALKDADLRIYQSDSAPPETVRVQGGFAKIGPEGVTVLAERVGS